MTCQLVIAVRLAGFHLPPGWTAHDSSGSPWFWPDFCSATIYVGLAGHLRLENRCGFRRTFYASKIAVGIADFLRQKEFRKNRMSDGMPNQISKIGCQLECEKECQKECQIEWQKKCRKEYQIE